MPRILVLAVVAFWAASGSATVFSNPKDVHERAKQLSEEAKSSQSNAVTLSVKARGLFEKDVQGEAVPDARAPYRPIAREKVDPNQKGTVQNMMDALSETFRRESPAPPPVTEAMEYARILASRGNMSIKDSLHPSIMGLYLYDAGKRDAPGRIELNDLLAEAVRLIGPRFAALTILHEGDHAARREKHHRLAAAENLRDEIHAFYAQYLALKIIDPRCERLDVLNSSLGLLLDLARRLHLEQLTPARAAAVARVYVRTLIALWDTHGERQALRDFVRRIGYAEHAPENEPAPLNAPSA